ncbi:MarR family transcriptional regulator [Georgenia sp. H159]|uniref:MarR family winged helix-turn-helix transcriptional regulator n=1 Tax=Georgenia sp. H159 TaxID=3076115 RepID=UPI002D7932CA|nr:MarR family transcriptional regulator [Georgenia sp. H159]
MPPSSPSTTTASRTDLATELRVTVLRLSRKIRSEAVAGDLSEAQYCVLAGLSHHGPTTPRALAERDGVQPPTMTRTIAALEGAGLVARSAHPTDGRQVHIELTDAGVDVVTETRRLRNAWMDDMLRGLSAKDRTTLEKAVAILRQVADV